MRARIVFATGNKGKLREIRAIMEDLGVEIVSMKEAGIDAQIDENGVSYEENAMIKARAVKNALPAADGEVLDIVMADDSGFEVDALGREPGIYSARFMGEDTSYDIKNAAILKSVENVPEEKRTARFVCAIAVILPNGKEQVVRATFEGRVAHEAKGTNGFGYDPIFLVPEYGRTDAELDPEIKNTIGHRGKALRAARVVLEEYLREELHHEV